MSIKHMVSAQWMVFQESPCKLRFKSSMCCHVSWLLVLLSHFYKTSWCIHSKEEALWESPTLWQINWERQAWDTGPSGSLSNYATKIFSGVLNKTHSASGAVCVTKELLASLFLWVISFALSLGQMVAQGMALREKSEDEVTSEMNDMLLTCSNGLEGYETSVYLGQCQFTPAVPE